MELIIKHEDPERFKRIRWLGLARSKDELKYELTHLLVRKNDAICTDGRRLHRVIGKVGLPSGQYKFDMFKVSEIRLEPVENPGNYPNVDNVLKDVDVRDDKTELFFTGDRKEFLKEIESALFKGEGLNPKFYEDTMSAHVPFKVVAGGEHRAVHFTQQVHEALVMPKIKGTEEKDVKPKRKGSGKDRPKSAVGGKGTGAPDNGVKHGVRHPVDGKVDG